MRFLITMCLLKVMATNHVHAVSQAADMPVIDTTKPVTASPGNSAENKWAAFWKTFTAAVERHDTATIAGLTSVNFYDGGGSTIQQWLQADVYASDKTLARVKGILQKGVKNFKGFDPGPYKATGKNKSGDLFFEYKKGKWLFGGIVGD